MTIEDEGPDIAESEMESVFKPFFRIERSRNKRSGGIGLGLATARTIARAHCGDVTIVNRQMAACGPSLPRHARERV